MGCDPEDEGENRDCKMEHETSHITSFEETGVIIIQSFIFDNSYYLEGKRLTLELTGAQ